MSYYMLFCFVMTQVFFNGLWMPADSCLQFQGWLIHCWFLHKNLSTMKQRLQLRSTPNVRCLFIFLWGAVSLGWWFQLVSRSIWTMLAPIRFWNAPMDQNESIQYYLTLDEFGEMIHNMFNMPKKTLSVPGSKKPSCFPRPWRLPTIPVCPTAAWNLLQGSRRGADPWSLGLMANWDSLEKVIYIYYTDWWFGTIFIFPFSWECHHPNWRGVIFFRGLGQPATLVYMSSCWFGGSGDPPSEVFELDI